MATLEQWTDPEYLLSQGQQVVDGVEQTTFSTPILVQLAAVLAALLLAYLLAPVTRRWLERRVFARLSGPRSKRATYALLGLTLPFLWLVFDWLAMLISQRVGWPFALIKIATSLIAAWVVIRLTANIVRDPLWSKAVAIAAWAIAALNILGVLDQAIAVLDDLAFTFGSIRISVLAVIKGMLLLGLLLWGANRVSQAAEHRLSMLPRLTPSIQLLFGKLLKISLFGVAVLVALGSIGIDITALAVFTGAVGVGIGFGLQSIISNFVAGIILLVERSLKMGDFVELPSGVRGEVREINIRNTVITTNDNIDIIVPNSEFVSGTVTNWTFHDSHRRLRVPFGVAYGTDKELVRKAGLEAAAAVSFTLIEPKRDPQVWLVAFGDSSLNFELVVWLTPDAVKRPAAVNAAYCWALETSLSKHGIEIPFPQRDLRIRGTLPMQILAEPLEQLSGQRGDGGQDVH